ncbi:aldo/keto reductase [Novosphingobium sp. BL-8A]|uniref:aldo/keto reductase n=1 Tax=Novosphingobium sp. BL-8A TaxID=3127639 RepID=UPI0037566572
MAYGAQSGGYFTKRAKGADLGEQLTARYANPANPANPANDARLAAAVELAERRGVSVNEVVLAYLTNQPDQTVPIFGGSSPEQVRESVKAATLTLSAAELAQLRVA